MRRRAAVVLPIVLALFGGCAGHGAPAVQAQDQRFLNSVYTQAPDISSYRTSSQLVTLGQAVCQDLQSGASIQTIGDRLPLVEGSLALPPADLGVVISSAVGVFCPKFHGLLT